MNDDNIYPEYEKRISYMIKFIEVLRWESCAIILAYLNIYGKMTAQELREKTKVGEKSIFRSLKRLIVADMISKELNDRVTDKRRNSFYYVSNDNISDPEMDSGFLRYLTETDRFHLISQWLLNTNRGSIGMIKAITRMMEESINQSTKEESFDQLADLLGRSLYLELVVDVPKSNQLKERIQKFLREEILPHKEKDQRNPKLPMKNPVGFYLALMPVK